MRDSNDVIKSAGAGCDLTQLYTRDTARVPPFRIQCYEIILNNFVALYWNLYKYLEL
jgi:hypothetical protein